MGWSAPAWTALREELHRELLLRIFHRLNPSSAGRAFQQTKLEQTARAVLRQEQQAIAA
jgi:hypothetical protein